MAINGFDKELSTHAKRMLWEDFKYLRDGRKLYAKYMGYEGAVESSYRINVYDRKKGFEGLLLKTIIRDVPAGMRGRGDFLKEAVAEKPQNNE
jgi:hypothetical protein